MSSYWSRDQQRLEALEGVLDELRERGSGVAVLVEGLRDVASLKALLVPEPIVKINIGSSLLNLCEDLVTKHDAFIVLTDWDRKGQQLATRLEQLLRSSGAEVDLDLRRRLRRMLPYQIHEVESIDSHVQRLRASVGLEDRRTPSG